MQAGRARRDSKQALRANARIALDILTEYGIPLTDEEDTTE